MTTKTEPINVEQTWDPRATDLITIKRDCSWCKGTTTIKVSDFLYLRWSTRQQNIQDVWPHIPLDLREAMITGYHSRCFEEIFKDTDDG